MKGHGLTFSQPTADKEFQTIRLQQERIVSLGRIQDAQRAIGQQAGQRPLFGQRKQDVGCDTHHQDILLKRTEDFFRTPAAGTHIVGIGHARQADVAVGIESINQLAALVVQVCLYGKQGG